MVCPGQEREGRGGRPVREGVKSEAAIGPFLRTRLREGYVGKGVCEGI